MLLHPLRQLFTELCDREGHLGVVLRHTGVGSDLIVFIANRGEWLEVSVHIENVSALQINEGRGRIGESLLGTQAHDVLDSLVEKLSRHDHTISLSIVGDEFENGTARHVW
jgi:hypothetical protein